jgi:signal transduction histidine kinase/ActR/RegA family two-component response regulator
MRDRGARQKDQDEPGPVRSGLSLTAPYVLFGIVVLISTLLAAGARDVLQRQQDSLLQERTNEVRTILLTSMNDAATVLSGAGASAVAEGQSRLFDTLTAPSTANHAEVLTARLEGDRLITIARAGVGGSRIGVPITGDLAAVARRGLAAKGMVSAIFSGAQGRSLVLAMTVPGDPQVVSVLSSPLTLPTQAPTDPHSPYHELNVSLYAATSRTPATEVFTSGAAPGSDAVTTTLPVGAETWLLAVSPRDGLVSALVRAFPWLVLGIGVALGILLGLLTEVMTRRRAYALRLVAERTAALREAEATATRANRAKSEFLSRMSHELRTPLNAILGFSQLLGLDDDLTEDQRENVEQISKGGSHLLDLINEILDISRIETGYMSMSPEPVRVGDVVAAAGALLRPLAEERGIQMAFDIDDAADRNVFADRQRLSQILLNLIGNGIKYNRQGGSVSITCAAPEPGRLRILVTDTGPGIAADNMHLLFAPFERLGAELTSIPGTGVGLALSRGLAEAMGGSVDIESTPGRGTTAWVELPTAADPLAGTVPGQREAAPRQGTPQHVVLHIEDNETNLRLVERVLAQRPDVTVLPALQGRLGLDLARRHHPALILLDLNLIDLPGTEVLAELRSDPETASIPVVVISADATPRQSERLLDGGARAYLTKPVDIRQLLELVDECTITVSGRR